MRRSLAAAAAAVLAAAQQPPGWVSAAGTNDVDGCGNVCSNATRPFVCLGSAASEAACAAMCLAAGAGCTLYTWSSTSTHCWTRTDGAWAPAPADGDASACDPARVAGCAPPPPPYNGSSVTVTIAATPSGRANPLHPAITLDFWRSDDPTYGVKWGNASAITIDLANPALVALASDLAPALLRLGGSPEDSLKYDSDGTCTPGSGGAGPFPGYFCSQVHPYTYDCLTPARWDALLAFGVTTGLKVVLGLNGCFGRPNRTAPMDFSDIRAIMADAAKSAHVSALWGFELSNEVVPGTIDPAAYGADMATLSAIAASIFPPAGLPMPAIAGPDNGGASTLAAVAADTPAGVLTAVTYHEYVQCTATRDSFVLSPSCLATIDSAAVGYVEAVGAVRPGLAIYAGETADHSGGGIDGLTNTFRSSFFYAWQLSALPTLGVELAARQCFMGGDYELVNKTTFLPNPDYAVAWLFRKLVGSAAHAFAASTDVPTNASGVRAFAFDAAPATGAAQVVVVINLSLVNAYNVAVTTALAPQQQWQLTGDVDAVSGTVKLNGLPLVPGAGGKLPPWQSRAAPATAPLVVPAASITFATYA